MEMKKFEKFCSLCERTVSRQRLLGAEDSDIAYLLHGMIAAHPEEEYSPEQIGKLRDLSIKKESQKETERNHARRRVPEVPGEGKKGYEYALRKGQPNG